MIGTDEAIKAANGPDDDVKAEIEKKPIAMNVFAGPDLAGDQTIKIAPDYTTRYVRLNYMSALLAYFARVIEYRKREFAKNSGNQI